MKDSYGFDEYGRFKSVQSEISADTHLFTYSYIPGSHLISGYAATQPVSSFEFQVSKTYEPNRDLITSVSNTFGTATISAFNYENDGLGRRTARIDITPTLTVNNAFGYNLKSEVTSATMGENQYGYEYDPIGNRIYAAFNAETNTYSANALNQYSSITNFAFSASSRETLPSYDADGNMVTNGIWSYSWDAENRLTAVYSNEVLLVYNIYDHQSRRIAKIVSHGGAETQRKDFVYDGWNLVLEVRSQDSEVSTNYYTWGLDLSGSLQGAGGVGGLLAVNRDSEAFFPCFDANGNATEYVDASGSIVAHFAYDAFGNTVTLELSPFSYRFSTKYADDETGLYYYGYRYYSPEIGRWVNRDPIREKGGANLYDFALNNPLQNVDLFGFKCESEWARIKLDLETTEIIRKTAAELLWTTSQVSGRLPIQTANLKNAMNWRDDFLWKVKYGQLVGWSAEQIAAQKMALEEDVRLLAEQLQKTLGYLDELEKQKNDLNVLIRKTEAELNTAMLSYAACMTLPGECWYCKRGSTIIALTAGSVSLGALYIPDVTWSKVVAVGALGVSGANTIISAVVCGPNKTTASGTLDFITEITTVSAPLKTATTVLDIVVNLTELAKPLPQ